MYTAMITINLYLRCDNKEKKSGYVWVKFYVKREKVNFSTKVPCELKYWNEKSTRISIADKEASDKNLILENILSRINTVIVKYRLRNKILTRAGFLRSYNRPDDFDSFYDFYEDLRKKSSRQIESGTMQTHVSTFKKLKEYAPDLHFDDITLDFIVEYYTNLRKTLKNNENTAYKNMSTIRKYVNAAYKAGYMDENPFDDFSIKRTKANYTYLEEEELQALLKQYRVGDLELKLYKTLQVFLFMCFGSQHIGDAKKMKLEQFNENSFTYYRIKTRNSKPEPIIVPISKPFKNLVHDIVGHRKQGLIFENLPADQTMNGYLKTIAKAAGIDKKITHKTGRHTFATFHLSENGDLNSLRDILGHSDIRETLIYAHVLDRNKQRGMECFNKFKI